ncbi:MAG: methyltransferase domain-containing protein [Caldilineaceae bacterium]|nr:methyltransferase domain-containing protein [Caldilineaceae bacterium]
MTTRGLSLPQTIRHWLFRVFKRQQYASEMALRWQAGITPETAFWENYIATRGAQWPEDFQARMDPARPLQSHITALMAPAPGSVIHMLDVGAGPLTYLGTSWPGYQLQITAVDPLADQYAELFAKHRLTPPVKTEYGKAEELVAQFGVNRFDLVHARNCIDHSQDPVRAIEQMVAVAKPGGIVYLHHAVNEAETESYLGFHQWNFHGTPEWLYVSNQTDATNMTLRLARQAVVSNQLLDNNRWIITTIVKREPTSFVCSWYHQLKSYARWLRR